MLEQDKLKQIINLILSLNPDNETSIRVIEFVVWHANSKKLIQDSLAMISQQPTEDTEAEVLATLKRSIDEHLKAKP